jgi:hypothetical protein
VRLVALLRRPVEEIAADPALRAYGAALALLHVLSAFWIRLGGKLEWLAPDTEAICWPLLPDCEGLRVLSVAALERAALLWGAGGLAVAAALARRRWTGRAYLGLCLLVGVELAFLALDFRLRRNQHAMALWVTGAFLLVPGRRAALPALICLFYFWAGTLKLNWEWISGAALYRPVWLFSGPWLVAACIYVVALELVVVWGLLARRARWFWGAFGQVVVFHVFSWPVVGFFYPVLMFGILAIFPLCRWLPGPEPRSRRPALALAALYSALQLTPFSFPGDRTLTGEGRLFALHMFDARVTCEAWADVRLADGSVRRENLRRHAEARTSCDPILIHGFARNLCRARDAGRREFVDLDVHLRSRRASERELRTVIEQPDFCARMPRYHPFRHNEWIQAPR